MADPADVESAHSGLSGSRYDVVRPARQSVAAAALGTAILSQRDELRQLRAAVGGDPAADSPARLDAQAQLRLEGMMTRPPAHEPAAFPSALAAPAVPLAAPGPPPEPSSTARRASSAQCAAQQAEEGEFRLDASHEQVCKILFDFLDTNGDGQLTHEELRIALAALGVAPTHQLMAAILARSEAEAGTTLDVLLSEVVAHTNANPVDLAAVRGLSSFFAVEDDSSPQAVPGQVAESGLCRLLTQHETAYGTELDPEDVNRLMALLQIQHGEVVDAPDFVRALTSGLLATSDSTSLDVGVEAGLRFFGEMSGQREAAEAASRAGEAHAQIVGWRASTYRSAHKPREAARSADAKPVGGPLPQPPLSVPP